MPNDTRQIKFEIIGDARGLSQTLEQAVRSVQNFAKQMAQATGGIIGGNVGSGGPYIPGAGNTQQQGRTAAVNALASSVDENKKILDNLKGASAETLRTMADVASREMEREKKSVDALSASLDTLNRKYEYFRGQRAASIDRGTGDEPAEYYEGPMNETAGQIRATNERLHGKKENLKVLESMAGGGEEPPPPGIIAQLGARFGSLFRTIAVPAMLLGVAKTIAHESVQLQLDPTAIAAREAGSLGAAGLSALQSGDMKLGASLMSLNRGDRSNLQGLGGLPGNIGHVLGAITNQSLLGWLTGSSEMGMIRDLRNMSASQKEEQLKFLTQKQGSQENLELGAKLDIFHGASRSRVQAMRALQTGRGGLNQFIDTDEFGAEGLDIAQGVAGASSASTATGSLVSAIKQVVRGGKLGVGATSQLAIAGLLSGDKGLETSLASRNIGNYAMNQIATALTGSQINGFGSSSLGGMENWLSAGMNGSVRDNLTFSQNASGLGSLGGMARGGASPFGMGMNLLTAMSLVPNSGLFGQRAFATQLQDKDISNAFAGHNSLNPYLSSHGIYGGAVRRGVSQEVGQTIASILYADPTDKTSFGKTLTQLLSTKKNGVVDVAGYLKKHHTSRDERDVASILMDAGIAKDFDAGMGMVRNFEGRGKGTHGKGIADAAAETPELKDLKNQMDFVARTMKEFGEQMGTSNGKLITQIDYLAANFVALNKIMHEMGNLSADDSASVLTELNSWQAAGRSLSGFNVSDVLQQLQQKRTDAYNKANGTRFRK